MAVPGRDRKCPAQDSLLGRSKEAAEVGVGSGSLQVLTLGNQASRCSSARNPPGPALEKQPRSCGHGTHFLPRKPLPVQVSSADLQQVKTLPMSQTSGLLIPSLVAFLHIFMACPGRRPGVRLRANSCSSFPRGTLECLGWSSQSRIPGASQPLTEGPPGPQTGCYIHMPLWASPIGTK